MAEGEKEVLFYGFVLFIVTLLMNLSFLKKIYKFDSLYLMHQLELSVSLFLKISFAAVPTWITLL